MTNLKKLFEQATTRPWEYRGNDVQGYAIWCEKGGSEKYDAQSFLLKMNKANAQLITLAANHFEAVVNTLNEMIENIRLGSPDLKQYKTYLHARAVLDAIEKDASHV